MKLSGLLFISFLSTLTLNAQADLPPGYCQVGCTGTTSVKPFDFAKKASEAGDPNGGPLKSTTLVPGDEGQAPNTAINTSSLFGDLKSTEDWSAGSCGKSLNDDTWDSIQVVAPCGGNAKLDRMSNVIKGQHKAGVAPPTKQVGDAFYQAFSSPVAQANLETQWYCRFYQKVEDTAVNSNDCKPYDMNLGSTSTVAVGMTAKSCRSFTAPAFVPEITFPMGGGIYGCRKGMPDGSQTAASEEVNFGAWVLGYNLPLFKTESYQAAPFKKETTHVSKNYFMGSSLCAKNSTAKNIAYDETCPVYPVHKGTSATFTVGPIPITVEAGGEGSLNVTHFSRVAPMWANGRATPNVKVSGYASAYVNLIIAKGGVEASLLILGDDFDAYAFSGTAYLPKDANKDAGFYYSYQMAGKDTISTLSGHINAFAKFPVPKFIGWKWKKYTYTLFDWPGMSTSGFVYSDIAGPLNVAGVK